MGTLLVAQGASTSGAQGAAGVAAAIALFLRNGAVAGRGLQPVTARRRLVLSASRLVHFKKEVKSACALTLETPQVGMPHCVRRLFSVAVHSLSPFPHKLFSRTFCLWSTDERLGPLSSLLVCGDFRLVKQRRRARMKGAGVVDTAGRDAESRLPPRASPAAAGKRLPGPKSADQTSGLKRGREVRKEQDERSSVLFEAPSHEMPSHQLVKELLQPYRSQIEAMESKSSYEEAEVPRQGGHQSAGGPQVCMRFDVVHQLLAKKAHERSKQDALELCSELRKGGFFHGLDISPDAEMEISRLASLETITDTGSCIEKEGDDGHKCYMILGGSVSVETEESGRIQMLGFAMAFGDQALGAGGRYAASYFVADTPLLLISVVQRDYQRRIEPCKVLEMKTKLREYRSISAFMHWRDDDLDGLANATRILRFAVGQKLLTQGEHQNNVMIIIKGFCEATKMVDGRMQPFGILSLGDTLDLQKVLEQEPVSYTATASAIVDVMTFPFTKVVQQKDGVKMDNFQPLLDAETVAKLLARERKPPASDEMLLKLKENDDVWHQYKNQLVSGLVWDNRFMKYTRGQGTVGAHSKYANMDFVDKLGKQKEQPGEAPRTLTAHISPAVVPAYISASMGHRESYVLDKVKMGQWIVAKEEGEIRLNEQYYHVGFPGEDPIDPEKIFKQKIMSDWPAPDPKTRTRMEASDIHTIAGVLEPAFASLQKRWKQIKGLTYRDEMRSKRVANEKITPNHPTHKRDCKSGPKELDWKTAQTELLRPPSRTNLLTSTKKNDLSESSQETSASRRTQSQGILPWRPAGYNRGGCNLPRDAPFAEPCKPAPDWSIRGKVGDRWVLKGKEPGVEEKRDWLYGEWSHAGTHKERWDVTWNADSQQFDRKLRRKWANFHPAEEEIKPLLLSSMLQDPSMRPATLQGACMPVTALFVACLV